jgi:proteic killer suppression protein
MGRLEQASRFSASVDGGGRRDLGCYARHNRAIRSFRDKRTVAVYRGLRPKGFPADLFVVAARKLRYLDAAKGLENLRVPPGNRLEPLAGRRDGQHSIRINDQWRICFRWRDGAADDVEIVDYH